MKLVLKYIWLAMESVFFSAGWGMVVISAESVTKGLLCILIGTVCFGSVYIAFTIEQKKK